jgi:hypothetical protein
LTVATIVRFATRSCFITSLQDLSKVEFVTRL